MGARFSDLEPRQMDRLQTELVEVLAANVAYPSFFDYRSGTARIRPVDRAKRDEIDQYLRSANFEPLNSVDPTSPEVRRFLERLMLRYIEVNPAFTQRRLMRHVPALRARVPRMAAAVHRGLLAFLGGDPTAASFGVRRQQPSWLASAPTAASRSQARPREARERNTRVLEAILVRQELGAGAAPAAVSPPPSPVPAPPPVPASAAHSPAAAPEPRPVVEQPPAWLVGGAGAIGSGDLTVPVPAQGWPSPPGDSPFAGLESGAQSAVFGNISTADDLRAITERPTGPLPVVPGRAPAARSVEDAPHTPRELPSDLYQLYGDYLRDMEPEVEPPPQTAPHAIPTPGIPMPAPADNGASAPRPPLPYTPAPVPPPTSAPQPPADEGARSDKLIFWQLRYQLEAYVRRAAQSYGVRGASDDPFSMLDALRRSSFVDESDLRIAEGILALTDRVTAIGSASVEDYRQAFLLYLLYHRSHLGV